MTTVSTTPTFNLKVIVSETGIKPDTLRAWERRYGMPKPKRSKGKQRLYSEYDLEILKWLLARQEEGLSISRAVKLWKKLEDDGQNPLLVYREEAENQTAVPQITGSRIEEIRQLWIDACHRFDEAGAEQILAQAFAIYPPDTVCLQVIMQGLSIIGNQWYQGEVSVQQEHFASALAMRRLHTLMAAAPPPTRKESIIVACPPYEDHAFAPLLISLLLRYKGWHVVYLGPDVPSDRFESVLDSVKPNLVLLTAQLLHTAASLLQISTYLREQQIQVAFGGMIFNLIPDLHKRIPGHYLGARLEDTPHMIENLISFEMPIPEPEPISEEYQIAVTNYKQNQSKIEAELWNTFQERDMAYEHFVNINMHMARNIKSALTLGNMDYIQPELSWVEQLLVNYQWAPGALQHYLMAYHSVANLHLGNQGQPVLDWLNKVVKS